MKIQHNIHNVRVYNLILHYVLLFFLLQFYNLQFHFYLCQNVKIVRKKNNNKN